MSVPSELAKYALNAGEICAMSATKVAEFLNRRQLHSLNPTRQTASLLTVLLLLGSIMSSQTRSAPPTTRESPPRRLQAPAVAGVFYPNDPVALRNEVEGLLAQAKSQDLRGLRALISPHAGYRYSGGVAASGFKQLVGRHFERVIILAPSHRVAFHGVAIPDADGIRMPLGTIPFSPATKTLAGIGPFIVNSAPHAQEHALEVQLPFLQLTLGTFDLLPLVFGNVEALDVAKHVENLVDSETLLVASSDLSHFHEYSKARELDASAIQSILQLDIQALERQEACGKGPILTLLSLARARGWKATLLDARNSGDFASDRSRVVGYASIAFTETRSP